MYLKKQRNGATIQLPEDLKDSPFTQDLSSKRGVRGTLWLKSSILSYLFWQNQGDRGLIILVESKKLMPPIRIKTTSTS